MVSSTDEAKNTRSSKWGWSLFFPGAGSPWLLLNGAEDKTNEKENGKKWQLLKSTSYWKQAFILGIRQSG
ncbi:MAG: hypothetical protein ACE5FY_06360, partial [Nitrospiria bacterium]